MPDVSRLIFGFHTEEHIARHGVDVEEVREVCEGDPITDRGRKGTLLVWGQTHEGRHLVVVLAPREHGAWRVMTSRGMTTRERRSYNRRRKK
jgi:hypothetical protein